MSAVGATETVQYIPCLIKLGKISQQWLKIQSLFANEVNISLKLGLLFTKLSIEATHHRSLWHHYNSVEVPLCSYNLMHSFCKTIILFI